MPNRSGYDRAYELPIDSIYWLVTFYTLGALVRWFMCYGQVSTTIAKHTLTHAPIYSNTYTHATHTVFDVMELSLFAWQVLNTHCPHLLHNLWSLLHITLTKGQGDPLHLPSLNKNLGGTAGWWGEPKGPKGFKGVCTILCCISKYFYCQCL